MLHSHTKIWVHLIWATKNRHRILFKDVAKPLYDHFLEKVEETDVPFELLNIQPEHVHALIDLPPNRCLSDIMQIMKGESSHWINKNKLLKNHFGWQRGYGAYSVSASQLKSVKAYIQNQTEHLGSY